MTEPRKLRVFLCHASQDKPIVRELYKRLNAEGWIDPWLDEEKLLPGQDWDLEIEKAMEITDAVIVCLSNNSVSKEGYVQKEIRMVLSIALQKPEGTIFILPVRFNNCNIPRRLGSIQYIDFFPQVRIDWAYERLLRSLMLRAQSLDVLTKNGISAKSAFQDPPLKAGKTQIVSKETSNNFISVKKKYKRPSINIEKVNIGYSSKTSSVILGASQLAKEIKGLGYEVLGPSEMSSFQVGLLAALGKVKSGGTIFYGREDYLELVAYFQDLGLISRSQINLVKDDRLIIKMEIIILLRDNSAFGKTINL